ncbi:MAG: hypothetical protein J6J30_05570 [Clostridia bacterium]|nr:hypothetical protein [Oscillospiraceae bacterium]MBP3600535.1 hypothetical protein [Clostridia bacterium]
MEQALVIICIVVAALFFLAVTIKLILAISKFSRDLVYLNSEIKRTHGSERKAWKRRKRRLFSKFWVYFMN